MALRFLPAVAIMAAIFLLSHTPGSNLPAAAHGLDKLCHAAAYGSLTAAILFALHPCIRGTSAFLPAAAIILFSLIYGLTDEFHQSFIPGRFPSWQDVVADVTGALTVVLFWQGWRSRRRSGRVTPVIGHR